MTGRSLFHGGLELVYTVYNACARFKSYEAGLATCGGPMDRGKRRCAAANGRTGGMCSIANALNQLPFLSFLSFLSFFSKLFFWRERCPMTPDACLRFLGRSILERGIILRGRPLCEPSHDNHPRISASVR